MLSACPRVGPTEAIIESFSTRSQEGFDFLSLIAGAQAPGFVDSLLRPDGPGDACELVCQGGGGTVVTSAFLDFEGPGLKPVRGLGAFGGQEYGPSSVDQEGTQVGVAAFGDCAQMAVVTAGEFLRDQAEEGSESPARAETGGGADKAEQSRRRQKADAGDGLETFGRRDFFG